MQNIVKMVSILSNLSSELNILVLQLSNQMITDDLRYCCQFLFNFQVHKGHVIIWLQYLKNYHSDYHYITISFSWINALSVDEDIFSSLTAFIDDLPLTDEPFNNSAQLSPSTSQLMVSNLNIITTEVNLILQRITD